MVFSGTVTSDFEKLVVIPDAKKSEFIDFAATDFSTIRNALLEYIKAVYPLEYKNFNESDLGIMLIELISYMGAVMSLKADMLANENFLRTARNRNNIQKLLELIGVKMKGPTASVAQAKLTLNSDPTFGGDLSDPTKLKILPSDRTISVTSPLDGGPVNYTVYKVVNGLLDLANDGGYIELDGATESDNPTTTSSVYTNLALLEGGLVTVNGTFDTTDSIKKINLTENPVIEGSVELFVGGTLTAASGAYKQVHNIFFASGATDNIFEVVYDDDFKATIVLGDGIAGTSPPAGASYYATYRVGGGKRGNIPSEHINIAISVLDDTIPISSDLENITLATGGADAETTEHAKKYAPLTFRRQDRLVTLFDYTVFCNAYVGPLGTIGKAKAVTRNAFSSANVIDLYVLEKASSSQLQRATTSYKKALLTAVNEKKMITDEVVLVDGLIRTLDLVVTIKLDKILAPKEESIKQAAREKIVNFFMVDNFDFGKALSLADLNRTIFEIPDVRFSSVDNLDYDVKVDFNEIIQLNNLTINVDLV